jgi:hypothetical protein
VPFAFFKHKEEAKAPEMAVRFHDRIGIALAKKRGK